MVFGDEAFRGSREGHARPAFFVGEDFYRDLFLNNRPFLGEAIRVLSGTSRLGRTCPVDLYCQIFVVWYLRSTAYFSSHFTFFILPLYKFWKNWSTFKEANVKGCRPSEQQVFQFSSQVT